MPPNMANMSCRIYLGRVYVSREARRFQMARAALVCGWSISPGFLMARGASRALGATAPLLSTPAASAKPEFPTRSLAPWAFSSILITTKHHSSQRKRPNSYAYMPLCLYGCWMVTECNCESHFVSVSSKKPNGEAIQISNFEPLASP